MYETLNKALDIAAFHTFVEYLVARGPGGTNYSNQRPGRNSNSEVGSQGPWDTRQKHWRRIVDVCKICSIEWDFVGKVETFYQDSTFYFTSLGIPRKGTSESFPELIWIIRNNSELFHGVELGEDRITFGESRFYRYYQGLPKETLQKLYNIYKPDFELFGYKIPKF